MDSRQKTSSSVGYSHPVEAHGVLLVSTTAAAAAAEQPAPPPGRPLSTTPFAVPYLVPHPEDGNVEDEANGADADRGDVAFEKARHLRTDRLALFCNNDDGDIKNNEQTINQKLVHTTKKMNKQDT